MSLLVRLCTLCLAAVSLCLHADEPQTIVVTGHPHYPPFNWVEDGKLVGASVDLVSMIFAEKNIRVNAIPFGPWGRVQKAAQNSEFDLLVGALKTAERETYLDFVDEAYAVDPIAIFVYVENDDIHSLNDLPLKMGAANRKESFGADVDNFAAQRLNLTRVTEIDQAFQMLARQRIDYVIHGYYPSVLMLERKNIFNVRPIKGFVYAPDAYQAFTQQSQYRHLSPWFAERVKHYRENGTIDTLVEKHLQRLAPSQFSVKNAANP